MLRVTSTDRENASGSQKRSSICATRVTATCAVPVSIQTDPTACALPTVRVERLPGNQKAVGALPGQKPPRLLRVHKLLTPQGNQGVLSLTLGMFLPNLGVSSPCDCPSSPAHSGRCIPTQRAPGATLRRATGWEWQAVADRNAKGTP